MRTKKQLVSKISMILMLFFMTIRQFSRLLDLEFMQKTSLINDMSFLTIMVTFTVLLSIVAIYIPMLFIVTISFSLHFKEIPPLKQVFSTRKIFVLIPEKIEIYKKLNVIRC